MARNSNTAYDFDLFQPQPQPKKKNQPQKPQLRVVEQREAIRSRNFTLQAVGCVIVFFIGVVGILVSQIALAEITKQLSDETTMLNRAQADYRTLETELESSVALSNIEGTVTRDLGMTKLRDDQVTYVNLTDSQVEEVIITDNSVFGRIKAGIESLLAFWKLEDTSYPEDQVDSSEEESSLTEELQEDSNQEQTTEEQSEDQQEISVQDQDAINE